MLRYIYTGSIEPIPIEVLTEISGDLLPLTVEYCLPALRDYVITRLAVGICADNWEQLWRLAQLNEIKLLESAITFYLHHSRAPVHLSEECRSMLASDESRPLEPPAPDTLLCTAQLEWVIAKFRSVLCMGGRVRLSSNEIPALPGVSCRLSVISYRGGKVGYNSGCICIEIKGLKVGPV